MFDKTKNWIKDKWHRFKKWIIALFIPVAFAAGITPVVINNKVDYTSPAELAKECFLQGGRLHEGEKFLDKDGKFDGFKSVKCVMPDKTEKIYDKANKQDKFKEK